MLRRLWQYQKERFPLVAHGSMVIVFCVSVMLFAALQGGEFPGLIRVLAASVSTLIMFFLLRVADEFKDFEIDSNYRPHRAVPRGLVSLRELGWLAGSGAVLQFLIALTIDVGLLPILIIVWAYIALMTHEFFVGEWLVRTPSAYLLSHMLVMPLIAFYVLAFDWLPGGNRLPDGLAWLLLLSFGAGLVLEIGRKVKAPETERDGVETYSALWGAGKALAVWGAACALATGAFAGAVSFVDGSGALISVVIGMTIAVLAVGIIGTASVSLAKSTRWIEPVSGVIAMLLYVAVGPLHVLLGSTGIN
ncbi:MAG: UbiA family prenyltransferase [Woeseiaceae bacterium]